MKRLVVVKTNDGVYRFDFSDFNRNTVNERKKSLHKKICGLEVKKMKLFKMIAKVNHYKEELDKIDLEKKEIEKELVALASQIVEDEVKTLETERQRKRVERKLLNGEVPSK